MKKQFMCTVAALFALAASALAQTHEAVDLGLSSGTKWATTNVGAQNQKDFGAYFSWAETQAKKKYEEETSFTFRKDTNALKDLNVMADYQLTAKYDAATVAWGEEWRMPTAKEFEELIDECTWNWVEDSLGYRITGKNGNSIFLPAGADHGDVDYERALTYKYGAYWSASASSEDYYDSITAFYLRFSSREAFVEEQCSCYGRSVRPVKR